MNGAVYRNKARPSRVTSEPRKRAAPSSNSSSVDASGASTEAPTSNLQPNGRKGNDMTEDEIKAKLDKLADFQAQLDVLNMDKQALIDTVLTAEVKQKLADIEAEFAGKSEDASKNRAALEEEIKAAVKEHGASVKGTALHAVWVKGRTSWDSKKLEGLMMVVPQLAEARTIGEPSVSLRKAA